MYIGYIFCLHLVFRNHPGSPGSLSDDPSRLHGLAGATKRPGLPGVRNPRMAWENQWENHGKPWENHRNFLEKWWFHGKTSGKLARNMGYHMIWWFKGDLIGFYLLSIHPPIHPSIHPPTGLPLYHLSVYRPNTRSVYRCVDLSDVLSIYVHVIYLF